MEFVSIIIIRFFTHPQSDFNPTWLLSDLSSEDPSVIFLLLFFINHGGLTLLAYLLVLSCTNSFSCKLLPVSFLLSEQGLD